MSGGFVEFTFDEGDENVGGRSEKYKGEKGKKDRLSLAWWPGVEDGKFDLTGKPKFIMVKRHYVEGGVGYVVNKGPEFTKLCGGPPRTAIATIVVHWPSDKDGKVDTDRVKSGDFSVKPWIFDGEKFKSIKSLHEEFSFGDFDLKVDCTDGKYQKMTFAPAKNGLLATFLKAGDKGKAVTEAILQQVQAIAANIKQDLANDYSLEQLRDKLTGGTGNAGAAVDPATQGDIDDVVDGLLDE